MAYLINRIEKSLRNEGLAPRTDKARAWLQSKVKSLNPSRTRLMEDKSRLRDTSIVGNMYFYYYDPKTKEFMKYYDKFPLVIPIEEHADGFLGLNLHYIRPKQRLIFLDKLSETNTNNRYDASTRLRVNYHYLKNTSRIYEHTPCLKKYLYKHIQSQFVQIDANEWDIAALLPVENFAKASKNQVFAESEEQF